MSDQSVEERALATVNAARLLFGMEALVELPSARQGASTDCVLARALHGIGGDVVSVNGHITFQDEVVASQISKLWGVEHIEGGAVRCPAHLEQLWTAFDDSGDQGAFVDRFQKDNVGPGIASRRFADPFVN